MAVHKRGKGYQVNIMLDGQRFRPQFPTEAEALTWESGAKLSHRLGKPLPQANTPTKAGGGVIRSLSDLHRATIRDRWYGRKSEAKLVRNAEVFVEWAGVNTPVTDINAQTLADYVFHLRKMGNSNATINRKIAAVKVMLKLAHTNRIIDHIPFVQHQREGEASTNFLDFGEEDPILSHLMHRGYNNYYDLVIFLIDTGARIGEALKLDYREVSRGSVSFKAQDTKNGKTRMIPLTTRATLALERRQQKGSHPDRPFGDIRYDHLRRTLRLVFDHLGDRYESITQPLHVMRHSCASRLAIRGVDVNRIKVWMDHSSIVTTQRYIKLAPDALDDVVSFLEYQKPILRRVK